MNELRANILRRVDREREAQDDKWGVQKHPPIEWVSILTEEVGEVAQEANKIRFAPSLKQKYKQAYVEELVQVAAVAVAMIECIEGE